MSVERVGKTAYMSGHATKETWLEDFSALLEGLEQHSVAYGGHIEWSTLDLQTETNFVDRQTLLSEDSVYDEIRTFRVSALKVTP